MEKILNELETKLKTLELSIDDRLSMNVILSDLRKFNIKSEFKIHNLLKSNRGGKRLLNSMVAEVEESRNNITQVHKNITDSINYAERIQRSFLATKELLDQHLKDYFIFYKPKDIVSGDFYWAGKLSNDDFALVTADSTGHGVPGAIMSILNIVSLEKAIESKISNPAEIFNCTRSIIVDRLKNYTGDYDCKDGMDASLIALNRDKTVMHYAAAYNPIWVIRKGSFIIIKAEKMPIGVSDNIETPFEGGSFILKKGDIIYTLTDGYQDQFGGTYGKKFMVKVLRAYLLSISHLSMNEQRKSLEEKFIEWKGLNDQVDDLLLIGIKV